jgi:hypothetical protein
MHFVKVVVERFGYNVRVWQLSSQNPKLRAGLDLIRGLPDKLGYLEDFIGLE